MKTVVVGVTAAVLTTMTVPAAVADEAPDTAITSPGVREVVETGPVTVSGTATDDTAVAGVQVAVRDRDAGLWWDEESATWQTGISWTEAALDAPGATTTSFTSVFAAGVAGGSYWVQARAADSAANVDPSPAGHQFSVSSGPAAGAPWYVKDVVTPGLADLYPVAVVASGDHYFVADPGRYRVAAVDRSSGALVDDVGGRKGAGTGELSAARAVAADAAGDVYVADSANNRVQVFSSDLDFERGWGSKGPGNGQFQTVYGIAVGTGQGSGGALTEVVYTTDDDRVQKFTTDGGFLSVVADGLSEPRQLAVRPSTHELFVINARDREIVVYDVAGAEQRRFGSEGSGDGQFAGDPRGIAFSDDGSVAFVSDDGNRRVQAFDAATGGYLYSITGFVDPRGLDVVGNTLIVTDEWDYSLKEFDLSDPARPLLRRLFGGGPPPAGVNSPRGLGVDQWGRLFTMDWWNQRIMRTSGVGEAPFHWGQRGVRAEQGALDFAWDVAIQPGTNRVFVANRESHEIEVFTAGGAHVNDWGSRGTGEGPAGRFVRPNNLAFAPDGTLWVTDSGNSRIQQFAIDADGIGTLIAAYGSEGTAIGQLRSPVGIDVADDGGVWVADMLNGRLQRLDPATGTWTEFHKPGGVQTFAPRGVAVAPDGSIWATDGSKDRIFKLSSDGTFQWALTGPELGAGAFREPFDVAFGQNGRIYVSDLWHNRVVMLL